MRALILLMVLAHTLGAENVVDIGNIRIDAGNGIPVSQVEDGTGVMGDATISIDWDYLLPKDCASKLYTWNGKSLVCQQTDLMDVARAQRDHFMSVAKEWKSRSDTCSQQIESIRTANILDTLQAAIQDECHSRGGVFNVMTLKCDALSELGKKDETIQ